MSHQYDTRKQSTFDLVGFAHLMATIFLLVFMVFGVFWICIQLEHARAPPREKTLRAIADEQEVAMDIIRAINRYETRVVPELPRSLRQDLIWTEESLFKPLEARFKQRMALLERVTKELKEQ